MNLGLVLVILKGLKGCQVGQRITIVAMSKSVRVIIPHGKWNVLVMDSQKHMEATSMWDCT